MIKRYHPGLFAMAAAAALCACAAAPSGVNRDSAQPTGVASKGYKSVTRNGQTYFCRREAVTGSRTEVIETCLTQAQLDAEKNKTQDLLRRIGSTPDAGRAVDPSGGTTIGAMGN